MTLSKTVDKACLLDMTVPAADGADHPTAVIASPPGDQTHGALGGTHWLVVLAGPSPLGAQVGVLLPI